MTDYRERWIDIVLEEELGRAVPPDAEQLSRAIAKRRHRPLRRLPRPPRRRLSALRLGLGAVAALVIGLTVWLFASRADRDEPRTPVRPSSRMLAAGPPVWAPSSSVTRSVDGHPVLIDGWLFAGPTAEAIAAGFDRVELSDARAIVRRGGPPTLFEAARMARLLEDHQFVSKNEELQMLFMKSRWVQGLGAAVLIFTGQAMINGADAETLDGKADVGAVFTRFDLDRDGVLKDQERICPCTRMADFDDDGQVTPAEFARGVDKCLGSAERLSAAVRAFGGVDGFYAAVSEGRFQPSAEPATMAAVFQAYDRDGSGVLEPAECVCEGSRLADVDGNGLVTQVEFTDLIERYFGSSERFLEVVWANGGVESFYEDVRSGRLSGDHHRIPITFDNVFACYDRDRSGLLEKGECVCPGSQSADANGDGQVTSAELQAVAVDHFGTTEDFLKMVQSYGTIEGFRAAASRGARGPLTVEVVFGFYDRDGDGKLTPTEQVCEGSRCADFDQSGDVTLEEFTRITAEFCGSSEKFLDMVRGHGGPQAFYLAAAGNRLHSSTAPEKVR
ncbi:MAG: hypothetical protein RL885_00925 [Planctomycetota bacterium]